MEHNVYLAGYAYFKLQFFADVLWETSEYGEHYPSRLDVEWGTLLGCLQELSEHDDESVRRLAAAALGACNTARAEFKNAWEQHFLEAPESVDELLGNAPTGWWCTMHQAITDLVVSLPRCFQVLFSAGRLLCQVLEIPVDNDGRPTVLYGERFPLPPLQNALFELQVCFAPAFDTKDFELSDAIPRFEWQSYFDALRVKLSLLHRQILATLGRLGHRLPADGNRNDEQFGQSDGTERGPNEQTEHVDEVENHQTAADESDPHDREEIAQAAEPVLTVERWEDLAIGICEDGSYVALARGVAIGDIFPINSALPLDLAGEQWRKLLEALARSRTGNRADKDELISDFGYLRRGDLTSDDIRDEGMHELATTALRKLTTAIAHLGRKLREKVSAPDDENGAVLQTKRSDVVTSRFVVKHLLSLEENRLHFGRRDV